MGNLAIGNLEKQGNTPSASPIESNEDVIKKVLESFAPKKSVDRSIIEKLKYLDSGTINLLDEDTMSKLSLLGKLDDEGKELLNRQLQSLRLAQISRVVEVHEEVAPTSQTSEEEKTNSSILLDNPRPLSLNNNTPPVQKVVDIGERAGAIGPAELVDGDYSIKSRFIEAQSLDEKDILGKINEIVLEGKINRTYLDEHMEDTTDALFSNKEQQEALKKYYSEYKAESKIYDYLKGGGKIDLVEIGRFLDKQAKDLLTKKYPNYPVVMKIGNYTDRYEFKSKKEALLAIYQIKLHLEAGKKWDIVAFWEDYGGYFSRVGGVLAAGVTIIGGPLLIFKGLGERRDRLNEGMNDELKKSIVEELDRLKRIYDDSGHGDVKKFVEERSNGISTFETDHSGTVNEKRMTSWKTHLELAKFRGKISDLTTWMNPLAVRDKPIGNRFNPKVWLNLFTRGPRNKGLAGYKAMTVKDASISFRDELKKFNDSMDGYKTLIEKSLVDDGNGGNRKRTADEIKTIMGEITEIYKEGKYPKPFDLHFGRISFSNNEKVLEILKRRGVVPKAFGLDDLGRIKLEKIESDIEKNYKKVVNTIKWHSQIPDEVESVLLAQLESIKYLDFNTYKDRLIRILSPYIDIESYEDLLKINILESEIVTKEQITAFELRVREMIKGGIKPESSDKYPNAIKSGDEMKIFTELLNYLTKTTEGLKGEKILNIYHILYTPMTLMGNRYVPSKPIGAMSMDDARAMGFVLGNKKLDPDTILSIIGDKEKSIDVMFTKRTMIKERLGVLDRLAIEYSLDGKEINNNFLKLRGKISAGQMTFDIGGVEREYGLPEFTNWLINNSEKYTISGEGLSGTIREFSELLNAFYTSKSITGDELSDVDKFMKGTNNKIITDFEGKAWYDDLAKFIKLGFRRGRIM